MDIIVYNLNEKDFDIIKSKLTAISLLNEIKKEINNKTSKPFIKIKNIPIGYDIINEFKKANITPLSKSIKRETSDNNTYDISFIFNLDNNLLITGNGFDLEHNLKTKYTHFLNIFPEKEVISKRKLSPQKIKLNGNEYFPSNNRLLSLLLYKYHNKLLQNYNWIDIETELKNIINLIEKIDTNHFINKEYFPNREYSKEDYKKLKEILDEANTIYPNEFIHDFIPIYENAYDCIYYNKYSHNEILNTLEKNLDELINMLKDYLTEEVRKLSTDSCSKDILDIDYKITHVLNFNYTDTFRQLYSDIDNNKIDFIHGSLNRNNLVLGINETLTEDMQNKVVNTVYFKKYFQRIYKKTDYKYIDWLNHVEFNTVYIHGHSLDESDKEILEKIINSVLKKDTSTVKIFYYDEKHYRQEVTNLIRVLGKDVFQKYYFQNKIIFIKQTPKK